MKWQDEMSEILAEGARRIEEKTRGAAFATVNVWAIHTRPDGSRGEIVALYDSDGYPPEEICNLTALHARGGWGMVPYQHITMTLNDLMRSVPVLSRPVPSSELTPEGEQLVIPGCERVTTAKTRQGELW